MTTQLHPHRRQNFHHERGHYPTYPNYNLAYKKFVMQEFDFDIPSKYGDFLNVDHIFNHARAERIGLSFVRLTLVDADVNQMWGGEYEDAATASCSGPVAGVRFATDLLLAKVFRLHPPPINDSLEIADEDLKLFVDELHSVGISAPDNVLTANVRLALKKAQTGKKFRRVWAVDWDRRIFYFVMDFPMSDDDSGPDSIKFDLDGAGHDLESLTEQQVLAAKEAVRAWVCRNFS